MPLNMYCIPTQSFGIMIFCLHFLWRNINSGKRYRIWTGFRLYPLLCTSDS